MIASFKDYTILEKNINFFKENNTYVKIQRKVEKNENIDYYFLRNFSLCIKPLYVFVDKLLHNSKVEYTNFDVVILTIYCLSVIEKEPTSEKLLNILKIKNLNHMIIPIKRSINRLFNLFNIRQKMPIFGLMDIYKYDVIWDFIYLVEEITNDVKNNKIDTNGFLI